jgi:hypothetical protein
MWWLPIGTAFLLGALVFGLGYWQKRSDFFSAKSYRARYLQIVSQLEFVTIGVRQLEEFVPRLTEARVLDYYESSLRILETLLQTMRRIPPFGADPAILSSAGFLVKDCEKRVERTKTAFRESLQGKGVNFEHLFGRSAKSVEKGCYFCSRPVVLDRFSRVKVKLDGVTKEVLSCNTCKEELKSSKKVKVLHLVKDGKTIHWSESSDYVPTDHYWNINKRDSNPKVRRLELIVSNVETMKSRPIKEFET